MAALAHVCPAPREVVRSDPGRRVHGHATHRLDPSLPPQGYELVADDAGIALTYADLAGRRYGEQTLAQLRADDGTVPVLHIRDWPSVLHRGFMLDVSRNRVPTRETLERLVELLALFRYNSLQLYVEHTFAYRGHEAVWGEASPLTGDDLVWLDVLCESVGIELTGNQNTFGHMERWLKVDAYRHRAECPEGYEYWPGSHRPASVLAPTQDNADFALGLVREQQSFLRSRTFNIGCDETFELGRGASAEAAAARGVSRVYVEQLNRIVRPLLDEGVSVQFWGDIIRSHPELLDDLPEGDITALAWTYQAPPAPGDPPPPPELVTRFKDYGVDLESHRGFAANATPFAAAGIPFWLAAGTSSWNSLLGRVDNAFGNLLDAAVTAGTLGAGGVLLTDWGDNGHLQPLSVSYPSIVYGGAVTWCPETNADLDVAAVLDRMVFDDRSGTLGATLLELGEVYKRTGSIAANGSPLFAALCPSATIIELAPPRKDSVERVLADLDRLLGALDAAKPECDDAAVLITELRVAAALARFGGQRLAARVGLGGPSHRDPHQELCDLADAQRAAWLARSRPGGLDASIALLLDPVPPRAGVVSSGKDSHP